MLRIFLLVTALSSLPFVVACGSSPGGVWTPFSGENREVLADCVDDARVTEEEARTHFVAALDLLFGIVSSEEGDLGDMYDDLKDEVGECEDLARELREQVDDVSRAAADLFEEWGEDLRRYKDPDLRHRSELSLTETRRHYDRTLLAMRKTERKMERVLRSFRDQVLFLKHNLNARGVASLGDAAGRIDAEVADLVLDVQDAIDAAKALLVNLGTAQE